MLTRDYRPLGFQDICGQKLAVEAVKAIIRDPERSPRVLIFHGEYGTGKTSLARIFARALNCRDHKWLCGQCAVCEDDLTFASFYQEFDSAIVGHKDDVLAIRDDLFVASYACAHRVVVMDEFHLASNASQSAFLKLLEDLPRNVYVVFCTTELNKILPTIRSRAVELPFTLVSKADTKEYLVKIVNSDGISIEDALLDLISERARGHVRNAVMMLDTYVAMEDPVAFLASLRTSRLDAIRYLIAAKTGTEVKQCIRALMSHPVEVIKNDLFQAITQALELQALGQLPGDKQGRTGETRAPSNPDLSGDRIPDEPEQGSVEPGAIGDAPPSAESIADAIIDSPFLSSTSVEEKTTKTKAGITPTSITNPALPQAQVAIVEPIHSSNPTENPLREQNILTPTTIATLYDRQLLGLVAYLSTDWACNAMGDSARIQALLWALHLSFRETQQTGGPRYRRKRSD